MRTCKSLPIARQAAFTLIELLVVLIILGIAVSMAALSAQPNPVTQVQLEGERLAALLSLCQEEAQLRGRSLAWQADSTGYRFVVDPRRLEALARALNQPNGGASSGATREWQALESWAPDMRYLRPRPWPLQGADTPIQVLAWQDGLPTTRIVFPTQGAAQPFVIRLGIQRTPDQVQWLGTVSGDGVAAVRWQAAS
ncbi:prepilin-type N-terminal cleavage/methylation domain-containing protein [Parvibium lacunae]|uniref:Type II secretion system protein GspH n=1 Tax=Parvibium lacunae TaxID=1888893 RepID=A0A368KZT1_9BURK|nr:GspH/FimT family pseudopilin [Parvibium lacunae]RCS56816.1 type II secretion system protein GspH [Parvibium lacunae]